MKKDYFIFLTAVVVLFLSAFIISGVQNEKRIHLYESQIEYRDAFIKEYMDSLYTLKDEFVLNLSNEHTIHSLDSLGLNFASKTGSINYYRYALDINYLQEKLHKDD